MFYLIAATFFWGTSFIAGKFAYHMADPALVVLFRLIIASLVMLPLSLRYFRQQKECRTKLLVKIAWLGLLTYPINFLLQFLGLSLTSASSAATIIGIAPLMVTIVGVLVFKEKASLMIIVLGVVAFLGVALVVGGDYGKSVSLWGCLLVLLSTVVAAFWLRLSQGVLALVDAPSYTALSIQLGTLMGLPLILLAVKDWHINYSWFGMAALVYLGIGCSLIAGWCWNKGVAITSANISGIFFALEPVFGVLFAVLLLNEMLDWAAIIGIVMVVGAAGMCVIVKNRII